MKTRLASTVIGAFMGLTASALAGEVGTLSYKNVTAHDPVNADMCKDIYSKPHTILRGEQPGTFVDADKNTYVQVRDKKENIRGVRTSTFHFKYTYAYKGKTLEGDIHLAQVRLDQEKDAQGVFTSTMCQGHYNWSLPKDGK